jgi:hypothetical protein
VAITYATRAPSVASVDAHGTVTGVAEGAAWVVATATAGVADSIWVQVTKPNGPVLYTTLSRTNWHAGDTISVTVVMDSRTSTVGAASILVSWSGDLTPKSTGVATFLDAISVGSGVTASGAEVYTSSIVRLTAAYANGLSGSEELITFRLVARTDLGPAGGAGGLFVVPLDVVALDESSLLSQTTSTHYPLVIK